MKQVWNFLKGKKTYILMTIGAAYAIGIEQHLWQHVIWLDIFLAATGTASMRHAISTTSDPASLVSELEQPTAKLASPKDTP